MCDGLFTFGIVLDARLASLGLILSFVFVLGLLIATEMALLGTRLAAGRSATRSVHYQAPTATELRSLFYSS